MNIEVNEYLLEFCRYQHEIIKAYKEYIENNIHKAILENSVESPNHWSSGWSSFKRVQIPSAEFIIRETPATKRYWNFLQLERPVIEPDIFVKVLFDAAIEQGDNEINNINELARKATDFMLDKERNYI